MSILQMGFSASILILVVIIIRGIAINRLPKKIFLALWIVVLVRALIPFSISSPFSVYSFVNVAAMTAGKMGENPLVQVLLMALPAQILPENTVMVPAVQAASENIRLIATDEALSLLTVTWVVGTVLCVLYFLTAYIRFYKKYETSISVQSDFVTTWIGEHKIIRPISVKQSNRISTPLTYGVFYPVILMPEKMDWSSEQELRYILMHEFIHIRRFDTVIKLFLTAVLCLYWFNPLVWAMYILANRDLEITCDEAVLRSLGGTEKSAYALMLLSLEERRNVFTPYYSSFSKNAAEERIKAIMIYKKSSAAAVAFSVLLVIGMTLAFAFSAYADANINSELLEAQNYEYAEKEVSYTNDFSSDITVSYSIAVNRGNQYLNTPINIGIMDSNDNEITEYETGYEVVRSVSEYLNAPINARITDSNDNEITEYETVHEVVSNESGYINTPINISIMEREIIEYDTVYVSLGKDSGLIELDIGVWEVLKDGAIEFSVNEYDGSVTDYKIDFNRDKF